MIFVTNNYNTNQFCNIIRGQINKHQNGEANFPQLAKAEAEMELARKECGSVTT